MKKVTLNKLVEEMQTEGYELCHGNVTFIMETIFECFGDCEIDAEKIEAFFKNMKSEECKQAALEALKKAGE